VARARSATPKPPGPRPAAPTPTSATATATGSASTDPRTKQVHLTTEGIVRLEAELEILTTQKRPEVIGRIRSAKELGDLKENADYTAAREEQSFLEGRIQSIEAQLRDAVVIHAPAAGSKVGLGSVVTVETDGDEMRLEIVGTTESSPKDGRISGSSPVGRALLGGAVGDEVTVQSPSGPIGYRIVAID
jgi:transcription elongation factor GreA